jgi:16S rRNA (cytosine967-C5)-methyltransferase
MLRANNDAPDTVAQVNTLQITTEELKKRLEEEGVTARPHDWMPDCLVLQNTGNLEQLLSFREGLFYIQDAAAKLSVLCAAIPENARVLDCCASPGGKSFAAAIAMGGSGSITSCDVYAHKAELIAKGAARLKLENITARQQDATVHVPEWENTMDVVIADVPCSGLGIIRKKPDIRYKNLAELEALPQLQLQILENQARYVKKGGILMYATCTILKRENEEVVRQFLTGNPDFYTEPLELPEEFEGNESGMLTLIPGQHDTDGFFICRLRRKP